MRAFSDVSHWFASALHPRLGRMQSPEANQFWHQLVYSDPLQVRSATDLVASLGWNLTTTVCRFQRAGLPSPRQYQEAVHRCYAMRFYEFGEMPVATVAFRMGWATLGSFQRHLRRTERSPAFAWLNSQSPEQYLDGFFQRMIDPYRSIWWRFNPRIEPRLRYRLRA